MKTRHLCLLVIACFYVSFGHAFGQSFNETVYLKNGSVIKGFISEWVPNKTITLKTKDDNIFIINIEDIIKVSRTQIVSEQNSPPTDANQAMKTEIGNKRLSDDSIAQQTANQQIRAVKPESVAKEQSSEFVQPAAQTKVPKVSTIPGYRKPGSALFWSIVIPGGGQIYNKQAGKGLLMMASNVLGIGGMVVGFAVYEEAVWISGLGLYAGTWILSLIDAPIAARKINEAYGLSINLPGFRESRISIAPKIISQYGNASPQLYPGLSMTLSF